jgi:hypothetical protein
MCCAILGCSNDKVTDVSENNLLWGGYNPKSSYKTKIDIFLVTDTHFKGFEVSPEKKSSYWKGANVPDSIEEYHKATSSLKYRHVKGVVTAETIIRPEVLERHVGAGFVAKYDILYPYARILSGPFKGMLVKIFWISKYNCNKDETPYPHPEILTEISADNNRKKIPNTPLEPSR